MPERTITLYPNPKPTEEMLKEVYSELGVGTMVHFKKCVYKEDELHVTWKYDDAWQPEMKNSWRDNILQGYSQMGVVEALARAKAFADD